MAFENTTFVLNEFGVGVVNRFRGIVSQKKGNASGLMSREARSNVQFTAKGVSLTVDTVSYFFYADQGRGKTVNGGKGIVLPRIRKWIDQKGITPPGKLTKDQLAYLITRKIHREGYTGKFYVKDVVTEQFKKELDSRLADAILKDFNF